MADRSRGGTDHHRNGPPVRGTDLPALEKRKAYEKSIRTFLCSKL
jgi:hypothetical protein